MNDQSTLKHYRYQSFWKLKEDLAVDMALMHQ